jgi:hypothetical protein
VQLAAFKKPTAEETRARLPLAHPQGGARGGQDRRVRPSHYEDVLIALVRELARPRRSSGGTARSTSSRPSCGEGTTIIKVHAAHLARGAEGAPDRPLERPEKQWKYNPDDVEERDAGPKYQEAYQAASIALARRSRRGTWCRPTASGTRGCAVQHLLIEALEACELEWPQPDYDVEDREAAAARELDLRAVPLSPPNGLDDRPELHDGLGELVGRPRVVDYAATGICRDGAVGPTCAQRSAIAHSPSPSPSIQPTGPA